METDMNISSSEIAEALAELDRRGGHFGVEIGTGIFAACGIGSSGPAAKSHTEAVVLWYRQITNADDWGDMEQPPSWDLDSMITKLHDSVPAEFAEEYPEVMSRFMELVRGIESVR